jgi:hypothetical protein
MTAPINTPRKRSDRVIISLPKEAAEQIDEIGHRLATAFHAETGVHFELSRAQIIHSLIRQALDNKPVTANE